MNEDRQAMIREEVPTEALRPRVQPMNYRVTIYRVTIYKNDGTNFDVSFNDSYEAMDFVNVIFRTSNDVREITITRLDRHNR